MSIALLNTQSEFPKSFVRLKRRRAAFLSVGLFAACLLPFVISNYQVFQLTLMLVFAIAILGVNLMTGYNGQISLGHGAFYAIGAYVTAILMSEAGVPYWATLPISATICLVVGFLFGFPALRLGGHNLALATFALAVATPQILKSNTLEPWTGGVQGIALAKPTAPLDLPISDDRWLYFFILTLAVLLIAAAYNLMQGRTGRAIVAIRDNQVAAEAMGVNAVVYKALIFGISALYTGVAGSLGAITVQYVAPDSFTVFLSISLLVGAVVGGIASISGALYGAAFIQLIPNITDYLSKAAPWAIYGIILIFFMRFMPEGIAGFVRRSASAARPWIERSPRGFRFPEGCNVSQEENADMPDTSNGQAAAYSVVVNREGQYSIWPVDRRPPRGWTQTGKRGAKSECLSHIDEVWKDMRPNSLRLLNERSFSDAGRRTAEGTAKCPVR